MDRFDSDLNALLAQYRDSLPDREPGSDFMPKLWQSIDARRNVAFCIKRLTRLFVAGAAAICLMMSGYLLSPAVQDYSEKAQLTNSTYADVLAEAQPRASLAALGIVRDPSEANLR